MITRRQLRARSKGTVNSAFSLVERDWHSSVMASFGTPSRTSARRTSSQSPWPATIICGATPCLYNSNARPQRWTVSPPRMTIKSALPCTFSVRKKVRAKKSAATQSAAPKTARPMTSRNHHRRSRLRKTMDSGLFSQFVSLEHIQHLVRSEQPTESVPGVAIQKPPLEDITVQEAQRGSERQATRPGSQPAPACQSSADARARFSVARAADFDLGFPIGIAVVLLDPGMNVRIREVEHVLFQVSRAAVQHHVLVHFIVARRGIAGVQLFISAFGMAEEAQIPTRVVATMFDPPIEEDEPPVDEVTVRLRLLQFVANFLRQFGQDAFIGVEDEQPFVFPRHVFERPIFLFGKRAVPLEIDHARAFRARQVLSAVTRTGVHHDRLITPRHRPEALDDVATFISGRYQNRDHGRPQEIR